MCGTPIGSEACLIACSTQEPCPYVACYETCMLVRYYKKSRAGHAVLVAHSPPPSSTSTLFEMSATLTSEVAAGDITIVPEPTPVHKESLKLSGVLDQFKSFEVTPVIGREYPEANLKEWLESPDSDALLQDLATTSGSIHPLRLSIEC